MKRVMLIAYDFPPRGASGVFRMAKFARYLPAWGWQPVIVTTADVGPHPDPQLLAELPPDLEILRVGAPGSSGAHSAMGSGASADLRWQARLKPWIVPDPQLRWTPGALWQAYTRLQRGDIQVIMTSGPPFSTHLVGLALRRLMPQLPWLMDLRDPWSEAPNQRLLVPYKLNRMFESRCLHAAEHITVVTEGMRRLMMARLGVEPARITTITNGFDAHDLAPLTTIQHTLAAHDPGPLCIRYVGTIVGLRAEATMGFFAALQQLQAAGIDQNQLRVHLIGTFAPTIHHAAAHVAKLVEVLPFVSHAEAIEAMTTADVLLLVLTDDLEGRIMHTSKLFEYLAVSKPILNIAPVGEVSGLIAKVGAGISVPPTDVAGIVRALHSLIERYMAGQLDNAVVDPVQLKRFERRELAGELAHLLNHLTGAMVDART